MEFFESLDLAVAGEYVLIAGDLIEIKSRLLLPQAPAASPDEEPEDPRAELVAKLLEYQSFQGTLETLRGWEEMRRLIYFRGGGGQHGRLHSAGAGRRSERFAIILCAASPAGRSGRRRPARHVRDAAPPLSLKMKMAGNRPPCPTRRAAWPSVRFPVRTPCPRYDIVITFLALLELLRFGRLRCEQAALCETICFMPLRRRENRKQKTENRKQKKMPCLLTFHAYVRVKISQTRVFPSVFCFSVFCFLSRSAYVPTCPYSPFPMWRPRWSACCLWRANDYAGGLSRALAKDEIETEQALRSLQVTLTERGSGLQLLRIAGAGSSPRAPEYAEVVGRMLTRARTNSPAPPWKRWRLWRTVSR